MAAREQCQSRVRFTPVAARLGGACPTGGGRYHLVMPHEVMNVQQVARYLNLSVGEVTKLAARGQLPARKVGGNFQFHKGEIDHWVERRMAGLSHDRLAEIEHGVSKHHGMEVEAPLLAGLIPPGGVAAPLLARTRDGVIRALVEIADQAGLVYDRPRLIEEIRHREDLCPTALAPGVALPHPRHPLPHDIARSFLVAGRTAGGIPFGAQDGSLTRLFFLICCKDDRTHLHVLARISRMLDEATVEGLLSAEDAEGMRQLLQRREEALLARTSGGTQKAQ
jgi:PTS system nitrogen regulatory IIA component